MKPWYYVLFCFVTSWRCHFGACLLLFVNYISANSILCSSFSYYHHYSDYELFFGRLIMNLRFFQIISSLPLAYCWAADKCIHYTYSLWFFNSPNGESSCFKKYAAELLTELLINVIIALKFMFLQLFSQTFHLAGQPLLCHVAGIVSCHCRDFYLHTHVTGGFLAYCYQFMDRKLLLWFPVLGRHVSNIKS